MSCTIKPECTSLLFLSLTTSHSMAIKSFILSLSLLPSWCYMFLLVYETHRSPIWGGSSLRYCPTPSKISIIYPIKTMKEKQADRVPNQILPSNLASCSLLFISSWLSRDIYPPSSPISPFSLPSKQDRPHRIWRRAQSQWRRYHGHEVLSRLWIEWR